VREAHAGPARTMTTPRRTRGWREAGCFVCATKAERPVSHWDVGPAGPDWQRDKYGERCFAQDDDTYHFCIFVFRFFSSELGFLFKILGRVLRLRG
jgi:hypothetical protein